MKKFLMTKNNPRSPSIINKFLLSIFLVSGVTGLIYQVSWQRILTLYYGSGLISTVIIVGVFMFGLGFGALVGGRLIDSIKDKLKAYLIVELAIGLFGFISIPTLSFIGLKTAGSDYYLTLIYIFLFLSVPTFFMGSTLPILCRIFNDIKPDFLNNISLAYFVNTLGAAFGAIIASFVLISFFGLDKAVYFAALINFALAFLIFIIYKKYRIAKSVNKQIRSKKEIREKARLTLHTAYILVFITGFIALGYEIIWFGLISFLSTSSPYAFSSSLFVYLLGIALGSYWMGKIIKKYKSLYNKGLFFLLQFIIAIIVMITVLFFYYGNTNTELSLLTKTSLSFYPHPYIDIRPLGYEGYAGYKSYPGEKLDENFIYKSKLIAFLVALYQNLDTFFWAFWFIFIPTLLMGASFPLLASLANKDINQTGTTVGGIYFFNVLGNVVGVLITGFVLLPLFGTISSLAVFISIGFLFLLFTLSKNKKTSLFYKLATFFVVFLILIAFMPNNKDFFSIIYQSKDHSEIYVEEGLDGLVVTLVSPKKMETYINGAGMGHRPGYGFYNQASTIISYNKNPKNKDPKDILIIGLGMGKLAEIMLSLDGSNVTVVEISNSLIKNLLKINETRALINDPKLNLIIDDGRRFLYRTDKKYDIIAMEPLRPQSAYSNNIYSKEFFELVKSHLKENGIFQLLIDRNYDIMPNTILQVFPYADFYKYRAIASNNRLTKYNFIDFPIELPEDYADEIRKIEAERGFPIDREILFNQDGYAGFKLKNEKVNTDFTPWLEYFFGDMILREENYNLTWSIEKELK